MLIPGRLLASFGVSDVRTGRGMAFRKALKPSLGAYAPPSMAPQIFGKPSPARRYLFRGRKPVKASFIMAGYYKHNRPGNQVYREANVVCRWRSAHWRL